MNNLRQDATLSNMHHPTMGVLWIVGPHSIPVRVEKKDGGVGVANMDGLNNNIRIKIYPALIGVNLAAPISTRITGIEFMAESPGSWVSELETHPNAEQKLTRWHRADIKLRSTAAI